MERRFTLALCVSMAATLLAACGGHAAVATLPAAAANMAKLHRVSGSTGDLIYAAKGNIVYILDYPSGDYVTQFVAPNGANVKALCSDSVGNVYMGVVDQHLSTTLYEFSHGATKPSMSNAWGVEGIVTACAAKLSPPTLAVATDEPLVALFNDLNSKPLEYGTHEIDGLAGLTWQDDKHLLMWCGEGGQVGHGGLWDLTEIRGNYWKLSFIEISLKLHRNGRFIQWDGNTLAALMRKKRPGAKSEIERLQIANGQSTLVGTTNLNDQGKSSGTTFALRDSGVLVPIGKTGHDHALGIYPYPDGGDPQKVITGYDVDSLTISVAPTS